MGLIWSLFRTLVFLFFLALIGRLVIDWVQVLARDWKPRGIVLVLAEAVYTVTDPPLKALRKVIPAVSFGGLRIDFAFLVLMVVTSVVMNLNPV